MKIFLKKKYVSTGRTKTFQAAQVDASASRRSPVMPSCIPAANTNVWTAFFDNFDFAGCCQTLCRVGASGGMEQDGAPGKGSAGRAPRSSLPSLSVYFSINLPGTLIWEVALEIGVSKRSGLRFPSTWQKIFTIIFTALQRER